MQELDLVAALGSQEEGSFQVLSVYIPSRDSEGHDFDPARWRSEALRLLSDIGGGATAMPPAEGAWLNVQTQQLVVEPVTVVYTYARASTFRINLLRLREFLHRMGRETRQGEVVCEFDRVLYRIRSFDP